MKRPLICLFLTLWMPLAVFGQAGIGPKIQGVYDKTKTAKTEADFTEIIDQCQSLLAQTENADRKNYLTSLLAWGLNKRGELYAEQAATAEDLNNASELDDLALEDFEAAISFSPKLWRALHNRGVSYALLGRHDEAVKDFTAALTIQPGYANSWFNRAEIRFEAGKIVAAESDYTKVIELSPEDVGAMTGRAKCRLKQNNVRFALSDLNKAIEIAPSSDLTVLRGLAFQQIHQWKQAASEYRKAIEQDQANAEAYRAAAWLMATCPQQEIRNADLAVQAAQRALALEEKTQSVSAETLDTLAAAHANAGNPTKAAQFARSALEKATGPDRAAIESRLRLYETGKVFRIAATGTSATRR